jgi:hypothetical protein
MPISRKAIMAATIAQSSWNGKPRDDSDDQGKGSDHDDRPQRDPDCEWHAPISLHGRSDQTRGGFLYHTENLPSEGARISIGRSIAIVWGRSAMGARRQQRSLLSCGVWLLQLLMNRRMRTAELKLTSGTHVRSRFGEHNMPSLRKKTLKVVPTPLAEAAPTAPPALKVLNPTVELKCGNCGAVLMHGDRSKTGPLIVHCLSCNSYNSTVA